MNRLIKRFLHDTEGAVTVDWVVLTAGIVGLCIAMYMAMETSTLGLRDGVVSQLEEENSFP